VGCFGLIYRIRRHDASDAPDARYLILDNIGGRGSEVNYVLDETVLMPVRSDPELVALAERVAQANPALGAKPFHYKGLYSELSIATVHGQKALGLLDFDPVSKMPTLSSANVLLIMPETSGVKSEPESCDVS